jgi:6-phosphogluconolactonase
MSRSSVKEVDIYSNSDDLSEAAAGFMTDLAVRSISERGRFVIALAGGSSPRRLYQALADPSWRDRINWGRWHFFISDERVVPLSDPNSNFGMAEKTLLSKVPVRPEQVHLVPTEAGDPDTVARAYEADIRQFFGVGDTEMPRFDAVLLGMGSDGHTASLFPGKPALEEKERLVAPSPPGVLPPPVERVTFTYPLINSARAVIFLLAGADKQAAFRSVRDGVPLEGTPVVPAARVHPESGVLRWFVDSTAIGS